MANAALAIDAVQRERGAQLVQLPQAGLQLLQCLDPQGDLAGFLLQQIENHPARGFPAAAQGEDFCDIGQREIQLSQE
jgi:hypothetical protein